MENYPLISIVIPTHNRKQKLIRLINSILESDYPKDKLEIIVVDDASTDGTYEEIKKMFPQVKIIRNEKRKFVAASRNIGFKNSKGEFIFFIDDDNVIDKKCILELVKTMLSLKNVGLAAPIMYYLEKPEMIWCAGVKRNMVTGKTAFLGNNQIDNGQFLYISESDDFPNAFIVRRKIMEIENIVFDDVNFPFIYEESDFCYRIKRKGWKIVLVPSAKIWHDVPIREHIIETTEIKAYFLGRNRILFLKKYAKPYEFLIFITIFLPIYIVAYVARYLWKGIKEKETAWFKCAKIYTRGVIEGLKNIRES